MRVRVFYTGSSSSPDQFVNVEAGATVRTALAIAKVPTENVSVRVNRVDGTLDQVLFSEDQIVVTAKNLKGADEEEVSVASITMTVDQIMNWGKGDGGVATTVVGKALAQQAEDAQKVLLTEVKKLIADAKPEAAYLNNSISQLEKQLAEAKDSRARFGYALNELTAKENPFALLAVMGQKDRAYALCAAIGCEVPDAKSPLWKTSAAD